MPTDFAAGEDWRLVSGDCAEAMAEMAPDSVDAVVTDPPYGLEFMGKEWDRLGAPEGFRRAGNPADVDRDSIHGRMSRTAPEYTTGAGRTSKPGIGERPTEWPSNRGWNEWRCAECGHLMHGGSPCRCEHPRPARQDDRWNLMQEWHFRWATEALRVLKPGGHLISFGGERTYHRMACAVEDAGFEIRFMLLWLQGQGFPKSLDVSKAMDKTGGAVTESALDAARQWHGWGTALKPAATPILLARKPLSEKNIAANILKWGTGCLNIDACRISTEDRLTRKLGRTTVSDSGWISANRSAVAGKDGGRWPANVILTHHPLCSKAGERRVEARVINRFTDGAKPFGGGAGHGYETLETSPDGMETVEVWACVPDCPVRMLDSQSGLLRSGYAKVLHRSSGKNWSGGWSGGDEADKTYGDEGGASRFFKIAGFSEEDDLWRRAKVVADAWWPAIANTVEGHSSLSSDLVASVLSDAVTLASRGAARLQGLTGLSTNVTPSELKRLCVGAIALTLNSDERSLPVSGPISGFRQTNAASAEGRTQTGITMTTQGRSGSGTCAVIATLSGMYNSTAPGVKGFAERFRYEPKATTSERNAGLEGGETKSMDSAHRKTRDEPGLNDPRRYGAHRRLNFHPTVKPISLMRYLCRLVTPPGGLVLDPFVGSGSTGIAAIREGFRFVGIDLSEEYLGLAAARIAHWEDSEPDSEAEQPGGLPRSEGEQTLLFQR